MNRHSADNEIRTRTRDKDGSLFVLVPGGEFMMGSSDFANESPPHRVQVRPFWICQTETTNAMYGRFREATNHRTPDFAGDDHYNGGDQPVVGVDYDDALAYCRWVGGRLATEAEWEFAARGTDGRTFPWGNDPPDHDRAVYGQIYGKGGKPAPVGSKPSGVSPFGVRDMAGNVLEWCHDWAAPYPDDSPQLQDNPTGPPQGTSRIMRGGCWVYQEESLRTTARFFSVPHQKVSFAGFRVVVDVVESDAVADPE